MRWETLIRINNSIKYAESLALLIKAKKDDFMNISIILCMRMFQTDFLIASYLRLAKNSSNMRGIKYFRVLPGECMADYFHN